MSSGGGRLLALLGAAVIILSIMTTPVAADPSLSITDVTTPDSVTQGDSFNLDVSLSADQVQNDEADVSLTLPDGLACTPSGSQTVSLSGGTGSASFDCTANVEGDYSGEITISATATGTQNGNTVSDSQQDGLEVISPAALSLSTSLDSSSIDVDDSTNLTAVVYNSGDASTSYTISLSSNSGYSSSVRSGSSTGTVTGGETETIEYTVTGQSGGDYTLAVSVSGGNGQSLSEQESLSVTSTGGGGTDSSSNDGSGDSTGDSTTGGEAPTDGAGNESTSSDSGSVTKTVRIDSTDGSGGSVDVGSVSDGTTVSVETNLTAPSADGNESTDVDDQSSRSRLSKVDITFSQNQSDVSVDASVSSSPPADTPELDRGESFDYLDVSTSASKQSISSGQFTVTVPTETREAKGVAPSNVVVYRYANSSWQALSTTHRGDDVYVATTPGFSAFAIGTDIRFDNARLNRSQVTTGQPVEAAVDITNTGSQPASPTISLSTNGDVVATTSITVEANATVTGTVSSTFDTGSYTLSVNDEPAGQLEVTSAESSETPTRTTTQTGEMTDTQTQPTTTPAETDGGGAPGFGIGSAIIAVMLVMIYARVQYSG